MTEQNAIQIRKVLLNRKPYPKWKAIPNGYKKSYPQWKAIQNGKLCRTECSPE